MIPYIDKIDAPLVEVTYIEKEKAIEVMNKHFPEVPLQKIVEVLEESLKAHKLEGHEGIFFESVRLLGLINRHIEAGYVIPVENADELTDYELFYEIMTYNAPHYQATLSYYEQRFNKTFQERHIGEPPEFAEVFPVPHQELLYLADTEEQLKDGFLYAYTLTMADLEEDKFFIKESPEDQIEIRMYIIEDLIDKYTGMLKRIQEGA